MINAKAMILVIGACLVGSTLFAAVPRNVQADRLTIKECLRQLKDLDRNVRLELSKRKELSRFDSTDYINDLKTIYNMIPRNILDDNTKQRFQDNLETIRSQEERYGFVAGITYLTPLYLLKNALQ